MPRKPTTTTKRAKPSAAKRSPRMAPRADFGKPIDSFFAKQPEPHRSILAALRKLVDAAAPDATSAIKWGMPQYAIDGKMFCALNSHKAHVTLVLWGPPNAYKDPQGLLSGEGKVGRHLKVRTLTELPRDQVKAWLATCAHLVRTK